MMVQNPNGAINTFQYFCDAIAWYQDAPPKLEQQFGHIIQSFKKTIQATDGGPSAWHKYFGSYPTNLRAHITARFKLTELADSSLAGG